MTSVWTRQRFIVAGLLVVGLLLGAPLWAGGSNEEETSDSALEIVVTTSILGDVVSNVAGDVANVTVLMGEGQNPHAWEPTPREISRIEDADLFVVNGLALEEGLFGVIDSIAVTQLLTASDGIEVIEGGHHHHDDDHHDEDHHDEDHHDEDHHDEDHHDEDHHDEDHHDEDHHDEDHHDEDHHDEDHHDEDHHDEDHHDEDHHEEDHHDEDHHDEDHHEEDHHDEDHHDEDHHHDDHHDHDHAEGDPHVWFDPNNVITWVANIEAALIAADPANADSYSANAESYRAELVALDAEIVEILADIPASRRKLVLDHSALGYFEARYGFESLGNVLPSFSDQAEPSAREVASLVELIEDEEIGAIFVGETASRGLRALTETVAAEVGRPIVVQELLTGSLSGDGRGDTYVEYMRFNARQIAEGLGDR